MFGGRNIQGDAAELMRVSGLQPQAHSVGESPSIIGAQLPMRTVARNDGNVDIADTQVIAMRVPEPRQWVITLAQATKPAQPTPWTSNFDGTPYTGAAIIGAPATPQQAGVALSMLQGRLRWGAGGVTFQTAFDYPMMGGVFCVTADTLSLDVTLRSNAAQSGIPPAQVPVVGAFMVPGQCADPSPLRWLEPTVNIAAATGASWSVKPFARRLRISAPACTKLSGAWNIISGPAPNTATVAAFVLVEEFAGQGIETVIDVPAQAEIIGLTNLNGALASNFALEWQMGLV